VTGAASGIGLELCAAAAARRGVELHMVDRDGPALERALRRVNACGASFGSRAIGHVADVTDEAALERIVRAAVPRGGRHVSVLINNACVVHGKGWEELSVREFEQSLRVGCLAHFALIKLLLPAMVERDDGAVVTISSLMGLLPGCRLSDYCAAKSAALAMHESLALELGRCASRGVSFTAVLPYAVDTGMFGGAFEAPGLALTRALFPMLRASDVAARVLEAVRSREHVVVLPWTLTLAPPLLRLLPVPLQRWAIALAGGTTGMDTWRGRRSRQEQ
jgi:short-subunit dehydrogenase